MVFDALFHRLAAWFFLLVESKALGLLGADFDLAEDRADGIAGSDFGGQFLDCSRAGCGDSHDGLVGFHLDQVGVGLHGVAGVEENPDDGRLGDGFTELGHLNGNFGHGQRSSRRRAAAAMVEAVGRWTDQRSGW